MTVSKFMLGVCLCGLMMLALTGSTINAQDETTITLPDVNFAVGESGMIEAEIACGVDWCGDVSLVIHFDPEALQIESVDVGSYLGSQHVEIIDIDQTGGVITFRATAIQDASSSGNVLFSLNVQALAAGQSTLEITDLELKDSNDTIIPATSVNGSVTISFDVDNLLAILSSYDWRIVFVSERDGNPEIYVMNADGSNQIRLTENDTRDDMPVWSPSGRQIAFISEQDGNPEIYTMNADGTNVVRLTDNTAIDQLPAWSPNGAKIAFISDGEGNPELYVMDTDGSNLVRLTNDVAADNMPTWSPDSSTIAFISERDGQRGVYTINAAGGDVSPVGINEGSEQWSYPAWSPDGTQIALASQDGDNIELQRLLLSAPPAQNIFDEDVRVNHLAWSRDMQWLVFGSEANENQDISVVLIAQAESETLTADPAPDYAPDLYDPQYCFVHTPDEFIRVRVGRGTNRGIFGFFPANEDVRAVGQAIANDGSLWWEVDRTQIDGGDTAVSLWVAQDEVEASSICNRVAMTDAPPIIPSNPNTNTSGGWGQCGSCSSCGPHPTNECVTSPEGACLWDPTTCRNVIIVTPDPRNPPGAQCFSVSLNYQNIGGGTMTPPSQSTSTANCSTPVASGYLLSTTVTITTQTPVSSGHFFVNWQGNCPIADPNSPSTTITITGNCTITAVYDILI